jgi:hypothetical protein
MIECLVGLLAISSRVEVINVPDQAPRPTVVLLFEPLSSTTAADLEIASKDCRIEVQSYLDFDRDLPYTYNIRDRKRRVPKRN